MPQVVMSLVPLVKITFVVHEEHDECGYFLRSHRMLRSALAEAVNTGWILCSSCVSNCSICNALQRARFVLKCCVSRDTPAVAIGKRVERHRKILSDLVNIQNSRYRRSRLCWSFLIWFMFQTFFESGDWMILDRGGPGIFSVTSKANWWIRRARAFSSPIRGFSG